MELDELLELEREFLSVVARRGLEEQKRFEALSVEEKIAKLLDAIIVECVEAKNELNWKWWKSKKDVDMNKVVEELADVQIFFMHVMLLCGLRWRDVAEAVRRKIKTNIERQNNGY